MKIRKHRRDGRWDEKKGQTAMNRGCLEGKGVIMGRSGDFLFICFYILSLPLLFPPFLPPFSFPLSLTMLPFSRLTFLFSPCHLSPSHPDPNSVDLFIFSFSHVPLSFPLLQVINVELSSVSLMPSRVEISLVKADPGSWAQLEHPDALAEKAKAGVGLEMNEEESEDSDDLSWTEEEDEEEGGKEEKGEEEEAMGE